ncbi:hypothetical protein BVIET440_70174 [Burkholderia vietnamiensis]
MQLLVRTEASHSLMPATSLDFKNAAI